MKKIVLIGAGGHAKTIVDTLEKSVEYEIAGFMCDGIVNSVVYRGYRILGSDESAKSIYDSGIRCAVLAIGFLGKSTLRQRLMEYYINIGYEFPVIVDSTAIIAEDVRIGIGTYIGRGAIVNADAEIGRACIVNTGAIIEHECVIGDFSHVAVRAVVCGQVTIGENVFVGANATVIQNVIIEDDVVIGAGALIRKGVLSGASVVGNGTVLEH